jgi:hypothetical protein
MAMYCGQAVDSVLINLQHMFNSTEHVCGVSLLDCSSPERLVNALRRTGQPTFRIRKELLEYWNN